MKKLFIIGLILTIGSICYSQNFKSVDKLGRTRQQIADTCAVVAWCGASNTFHGWPADGEPVDIYTGLDFAIVMFVYNKADICYKIVIKNSNPIIFDKPYKINQYKENGRLVYIIQH
jgi:hypothetical protein